MVEYLISHLEEIIFLIKSFDHKLLSQIISFPLQLYKIYTYYKTYKEMYYLRCYDRKCSGAEAYNITNVKIEETLKCSKTYENHNYIKESIIKKKLKNKN